MRARLLEKDIINKRKAKMSTVELGLVLYVSIQTHGLSS